MLSVAGVAGVVVESYGAENGFKALAIEYEDT